MPGSDRPAFLIRAFLYLVIRLKELPVSARTGLIERALALIQAGFSFEESVVDAALPEVEDRGSKRVSLDLVEALVKALQCTVAERIRIMVAVYPTYIFGQRIAQLRVARGWSRGDLVGALWNLIPRDLIEGEKVREGWLQEIEEGRKARISRSAVELLADALDCDLLERFKLTLAAGYGLMPSSLEELDEEVDGLEFTAYLAQRNPRVGEFLRQSYTNDPDTFFDMTAYEILTVYKQGLKLVEENDRREKGGTESRPGA